MNINIFDAETFPNKKSDMKNPIYLLSIILFSFLLLSSSCREGSTLDDFNLDMGFDYFPLEVGKYMVYQVDSTVYDFDGSTPIIIESTTYVKEELVDTAIDNEGDTIYVLERFERKAPSEPWIIKDVWSAKITDNRAERFEENVRLVSMVFPVKEGADFDATLFIDENFTISVEGEIIEAYKNWSSEIQEVGTMESIGSLDFDNIVTIIHADDENLIEKRYSQSKYAKGVGLVHREEWILDTQNLTETQPWEEKAEIGYILTQTILEFN